MNKRSDANKVRQASDEGAQWREGERAARRHRSQSRRLIAGIVFGTKMAKPLELAPEMPPYGSIAFPEASPKGDRISRKKPKAGDPKGHFRLHGISVGLYFHEKQRPNIAFPVNRWLAPNLRWLSQQLHFDEEMLCKCFDKCCKAFIAAK